MTTGRALPGTGPGARVDAAPAIRIVAARVAR